LFAVSGQKKAICCLFDPKAVELQNKIEIEHQKSMHFMNQPEPTISANITNRTYKGAPTGKTTMTNTPIRRHINFTNSPITIER
jgi:hypothetical protein